VATFPASCFRGSRAGGTDSAVLSESAKSSYLFAFREITAGAHQRRLLFSVHQRRSIDGNGKQDCTRNEDLCSSHAAHCPKRSAILSNLVSMSSLMARLPALLRDHGVAKVCAA